MKKILCAVAAITAIIGLYGSVYAEPAGCRYTSSDSRLTISGTRLGGFVTAVITPYKTDINTLTPVKINQSADIIYKVMRVNSQGYSEQFILPDSFAPGRYTVNVFEGEKKYSFYVIKPDAESAQEILDKIKGLDIEKIRSAVYAGRDKLGLDSDFFERTYSNAIVNMGGALTADVDAFIGLYAKYEGIERMKSGEITADAFFENYSMYIDSEIKQEYDKLTDAEQLMFAGVLADINISGRNISELFEEACFFSKVRSADNYKTLQQTVINYFSQKNISITKYKALDSYKQDEIFLSIMKIKNSAKSTDELVTEFNRLIEASSKVTQSSSGGDSKPIGVGAVYSGGAQNVPVAGGNIGFADIAGHWASDNIISLAESGIIAGKGDGNFEPESNVTRAEFVTMLLRATGIKTGTGSSFSDVTSADWFYGYVYGAFNAGVVKGVDETHFLPNSNIPRQDAAVMISKAKGYTAVDENSSDVFADSSAIAAYSKNAVSALYERGIVKGSDGKFNPEENVTRAEAVTMIANMMKAVPPVNTVKMEMSGYEKAAALIKGLTEREFLPDKPRDAVITKEEFVSEAQRLLCTSMEKYLDGGAEMTVYEAARLVMCALDLKDIGEIKGGYPNGYYSFAKSIGFLDGISPYAAFTKETAAVLLYNVMNTKVIQMRILSDSSNFSYEQTEQTYMEKLYNAFMIEGVVRETSYNSFDYTADVSENDYICIGSEYLEYDGVTGDILGYNTEVFYKKDKNSDKNTVLFLTKKDNNTVEIELKDASCSGNTVEYRADGRKKTLKLDEGCCFVYNGRTEPSLRSEPFGKSGAAAVFVDNDKDGIYEIIFIEDADYVCVSSIDREGMLIGDSNDGSRVIDLNNTVRKCDIYNSAGERLTLYNIYSGNTLEALQSTDGQYVRLRVIDDSITGAVESIDADDMTAVIDGSEYKLTDYFVKWYSSRVALGEKASFTLSSRNYLVSMDLEDGGKLYGYSIRAVRDNDIYTLKLLDAKNTVTRYELEPKVTVNGVRYETLDDSFDDIADGIISQLIIYELKNGKICCIDTAADYDGVSDTKDLPRDDKLTRFYQNKTFTYRGGAKAFVPYFDVASAAVFRIPTDNAGEEYYESGGSGIFTSGEAYAVSVYDIDSYGSAGAVVLEYEVENETFTSSDASYVIEKVTAGYDDEENEQVNIVYCWSKGAYHTYYMRCDMIVKRPDGSSLKPGDIVRMKVRGDYITAVCVDLYDNGTTVAANSNYNDVNVNKTSDSKISYVTGVANTASSEYAFVTNVRKSAAEYDTAFANLRNYSLVTSNIVKFNREEGRLRPVSADEIKTYSAFGADADYLVIRQNYGTTELVVIYD